MELSWLRDHQWDHVLISSMYIQLSVRQPWSRPLLSPPNWTGQPWSRPLLSPVNWTGQPWCRPLLSPTDWTGQPWSRLLLSPVNWTRQPWSRPLLSPTNWTGQVWSRPLLSPTNWTGLWVYECCQGGWPVGLRVWMQLMPARLKVPASEHSVFPNSCAWLLEATGLHWGQRSECW